MTFSRCHLCCLGSGLRHLRGLCWHCTRRRRSLRRHHRFSRGHWCCFSCSVHGVRCRTRRVCGCWHIRSWQSGVANGLAVCRKCGCVIIHPERLRGGHCGNGGSRLRVLLLSLPLRAPGAHGCRAVARPRSRSREADPAEAPVHWEHRTGARILVRQLQRSCVCPHPQPAFDANFSMLERSLAAVT